MRILAALFALLLLGGCAPSPVLDSVLERGELRVGTRAANPPFSERTLDGYRGLDMELASRLAGRLGVRVAYVEEQGDPRAGLERGDYDLALSGHPLGTGDPAMSRSYLDNGLTPVVPRGRAVQGIMDLNAPGEVVLVDPAHAAAARDLLPRAQVVERPAPSGAEVVQGGASAILAPAATAYTLVRADARLWAPIIRAPLTEEGVGIMVPRSDPALLGRVNGFLDDLEASGELDMLVDVHVR
ncbi:MAG: transporter substrate-binding domain-containing protein [Succinivibrionaceae bacterium]|nr:transporter substrate-binding domain-containing protein [Succinivibrionaceae bacterium]